MIKRAPVLLALLGVAAAGCGSPAASNEAYAPPPRTPAQTATYSPPVAGQIAPGTWSAPTPNTEALTSPASTTAKMPSPVPVTAPPAAPTDASAAAPAERPAVATVTMTDEEILGALATAQALEVRFGKIAATHAASPGVRDLADAIVRAQSETRAQADSLKMRPKTTMEADELRSARAKSASSLKSLKGMEFDRTYVEGTIRRNAQALLDIDGQYLPQAKNGQLRMVLRAHRDRVVAQLESARAVKAQIDAK